ncbi:MAG: hypothetical protein M3Y87_16980 [Myxococcota bacterium]|nr:hypothetical protein [Myxococcota bacterium]
MTSTKTLLIAALLTLGIAACGGPGRTETTTTESHETTESGSEIHATSTETTETGGDGATTTDRTETTQTSTPAE